MAKFVRFRDPEDHEVFVNPDHVVTFSGAGESGSTVRLTCASGTPTVLVVKGSAADVYQALLRGHN